MNIIEQLKKLLDEQKYCEIYELLKANINRIDQNDDIVLQSINMLIDNNYIENANELISELYLRKNKRIIMRILKNKIKDKRAINDYEKEVYKVYFEARQLGHDYYQTGKIPEAYYVYEWGYYVTKNPVFIYYMGKMLYKIGNYKLAKKYFNDYLQHCGEKTSKAYLYLGCIARLYRRNSEAVAYIDISNSINNIENSGYYIEGFYNPQDENVDSVKMYNQFMVAPLELSYFDKTIECDQFYEIRDLYIQGHVEQANKLLSDLESKKEKSFEEKLTIRLLRKNSVLFQAKNRS